MPFNSLLGAFGWNVCETCVKHMWKISHRFHTNMCENNVWRDGHVSHINMCEKCVKNMWKSWSHHNCYLCENNIPCVKKVWKMCEKDVWKNGQFLHIIMWKLCEKCMKSFNSWQLLFVWKLREKSCLVWNKYEKCVKKTNVWKDGPVSHIAHVKFVWKSWSPGKCCLCENCVKNDSMCEINILYETCVKTWITVIK